MSLLNSHSNRGSMTLPFFTTQFKIGYIFTTHILSKSEINLTVWFWYVPSLYLTDYCLLKLKNKVGIFSIKAQWMTFYSKSVLLFNILTYNGVSPCKTLKAKPYSSIYKNQHHVIWWQNHIWHLPVIWTLSPGLESHKKLLHTPFLEGSSFPVSGS